MSVNNNRAKELRIVVRVGMADLDQGFLLESHWLIFFLMSTSMIFIDLFLFSPYPRNTHGFTPSSKYSWDFVWSLSYHILAYSTSWVTVNEFLISAPAHC